MIIDNTISSILIDTAKKNNSTLENALNIIQGCYNTLNHIMEKEEPGTIKMDFLGKFSYSERYKAKLDSLKKKDEII